MFLTFEAAVLTDGNSVRPKLTQLKKKSKKKALQKLYWKEKDK